jgi:hypothetical protein
MCVKQCLVYTGARNGTIKRFDTRTRAPGLALLGDAKTKSCDSVTYLNIIKDWQLLVSTIRGAVRCFFYLGPVASPCESLGKKIIDFAHGVTRSKYSMFASCERCDRS